MSPAQDEIDDGKDTALQIINNNDKSLAVNPTPTGRTLLPSPLAGLISTVTGASSLSVKVGSKIGGWWIAGAREATLTGLELTRLAVEAVLATAGRDVSSRRSSELGREEAEGILEQSISALHSTISTVSFFAASSFYMSSAALNSASSVSIQGLATLNAILGSTESSRAVAAIITLIRDELNKEHPDSRGAVIGYTDLFSGTVGFVLLQRWGRRKTELEFREKGGEETIWDTVIDDKGFRADVVGTRKKEVFGMPPNPSSVTRGPGMPISFLSPAGDEEIEALERGSFQDPTSLRLAPDDQMRLTDQEIREQIMNQLPQGARAVITSKTITAKTIKVDIYNAETAHIEPPPGTVMISERLHRPDLFDDDMGTTPHQTVVFRTALRRSSSTEIEPADRLRLTTVEDVVDPDEDVMMMRTSPEYLLKPDPCETNGPDPNDSDSDPSGTTTPTPGASLSPKVANQKRSRIPVPPITEAASGVKGSSGKMTKSKPGKEQTMTNGKSEKTGTFKKALKSLTPNQSSTVIKDIASLKTHENKRGLSSSNFALSVPRMTPASIKESSLKPLPLPPTSRSNGVGSKDGTISPGRLSPSISRSAAAQTYFALHESRRESKISQTDTYSVHSVESRPGSPTFTRTHTRSTSGLGKAKSDVELTIWGTSEDRLTPEDSNHHRRSKSFVSSLYSMATKDPGEEIILVPKTPIPRKSIFDDSEMLNALASDGKVPGIFPNRHLVSTVRRFARFSSASYGSNFLRVMGLSSPEKMSSGTELMKLEIHHEHSSFSSHTGLPPDTILLSSFVDPQGVTGNIEWSPSAFSPLIHFISIDTDSKAVVLTCRGTLGFEDVLTDMTCDYDDLYWQGRTYQVHKGIHASANRLLGPLGARVMSVIKETLEKYPDFGLILCGHSLGGAVAALLALLISEPAKDPAAAGASFVTASTPKLLTSNAYNSSSSNASSPQITLPAGRPIHVYAYGTPATVSPSLRLVTRGLITTTVNHSDIVPSLSLGMLHDFRAVALNLKSDSSGAFHKLRTRVWNRIRHAVQSAFYVDSGPPPPENMAGDGLGEDTWAWSALKTLRASMQHDKLVPPGEVFVVESTRVFDREQFSPSAGAGAGAETATERVFRSLGRPATRVQFKLIRDVEARFGELRFGRDMFSDHSPGRYEASLAALERGILET